MAINTDPPRKRRPPVVDIVIEIPRGSFLKRGSSGQVDFVSPLPCPFNYGSVPDYIGLDGDLLDAVVLGPRVAPGTYLRLPAHGAIGFMDRDLYDDKLICSVDPITEGQRRVIVNFFILYARCKQVLNRYRGRNGLTRCEGWGDARDAILRARPLDDSWAGPVVPF
ncbi:MAG: inorganic diphosphatase [Proteobacteria bacterium]|nr:inorganic diphosphatase [Pseudomonadota bacterium]